MDVTGVGVLLDVLVAALPDDELPPQALKESTIKLRKIDFNVK
jgi:hypothetical protein